MSIEEVSAERFAQLFHHYHQVLGDDTGNAARARTCDAWANVPPSEKNRLIAACRLALLEVEVLPATVSPDDTSQSPAKPSGVADRQPQGGVPTAGSFTTSLGIPYRSFTDAPV
jgi:hypothetical protein